MQIDDISFNDISIFHAEESYSIFHKLNFTRTEGGKEWLRHFFSTPFSDIKKITGTQNILKKLIEQVDDWPQEISNGTVLVMIKFLDYALDAIGNKPSAVDAFMYRLLHSADYSMAKFSVKHFTDFFRGLKKIETILANVDMPVHFKRYIDRIGHLLSVVEPFKQMAAVEKDETIPQHKNLYFAANVRVHYKIEVQELIDIYSRLDAWYSMAFAVKKYNLHFPEFIESDKPFIEARGLYHLLLHNPVPYHLQMSPEHNFLFLTGANMAGKSTLIKSVGSSVFLAHIGMGVPASAMQLTMFDGLISNINVVDNIAKGESFFFNEVQRIKNTVQKISDGKKWLVLIDELFKGTNVEDAMRCSLAVIKGLIKVKTSLFILSTHLYEIGDELQELPTIAFRHFETMVTEEALSFSYQLKEGISKDRLGYLILRREKVVDMLEKL
ncbi:DNA mismatch repair protein MutS [Niabella yanshanensis]|uniref:DNA mismatch repair protein MutS n=1 Tax=Niabella yanshanensis TaxID=577386 RepID=A0ABZ0WBP4_9BACT|nr:DNA mismatch repair protein MutS [Niabella yanshanensis]WQD40084.1 DNA mismatch repair protein MutS [Niabella yanshanensis]